MFTTYPTYEDLRPLLLWTPVLRGEDVYALQHAMKSMGFTVELDGIFGKETDKLVRNMQKNLGLFVDGSVGPVTNETVAMLFAASIADELDIPVEAPKGQLKHESAYYLGRVSFPPRPNGSYDAGVSQRNTEHTPPQEGFKPKPSIRAMLERVQTHYILFRGVTPLRRRMALAQGSWNAPAFACYIAREEGATNVTPGMVLRPSEASRQKFEAYVANVSKYLKP